MLPIYYGTPEIKDVQKRTMRHLGQWEKKCKTSTETLPQTGM